MKKDDKDTKIIAIGVGGAGCQVISNLANMKTQGLTLMAIDINEHELSQISCNLSLVIELGVRGFCQMRQSTVREYTLKNYQQIKNILQGYDIVLIVSGLGSATGSGAAPVVAQIANEIGALVVSIATMPFTFEGRKRLQIAQGALVELKKESDSVVLIHDDNLLSMIDKTLRVKAAFKIVDGVLVQAVLGIAGTVVGGDNDIKLDYEDLETVMKHKGIATIGVAEYKGDFAAYEAINEAMSSPLFNKKSIKEAQAIIVNFSLHPYFPLMEVAEAMDLIYEGINEDAEVIWATSTDATLPKNFVKVMIIATETEEDVTINNTKKYKNRPITFKSDNGKELLLQGVHYNLFIDGLMAKTAIEQKYKNPFKNNIEAIYTFPLSSSAVLLNVEVKINDRLLKGKIVESSQADEQYEEAINNGNRAVMVEKNSEGIYTLKIGNILPEDSIVVILEYTELLTWKQDRVKLSIPTVIAQKYGDASRLNMQGKNEPVISANAENNFTFEMFVTGVLADSDIKAASHKINVKQTNMNTQVTLDKDFMNRDITFTFDTMKSTEDKSFALVGKSLDGYAVIASFLPSLKNNYEKKPKSITFVIDCSGSMEGVSISKARSALYKAIKQLDETDYVNLILFGSDSKKIFNKETPATKYNLNVLKRSVDSIAADMGGTEMEAALNNAYSTKIDGLKIDRYIYLITDGEIYDHSAVVKNAVKSEMSHYIVGVGYATDDALLRKMALKTKGSFENIDPNEKMDQYILNMFKKINTPKTTDIAIEWPKQAQRENIPKVLFDGDTLYAYAMFKDLPKGKITLEYTLENGEKHTLATKLPQNISKIIPSVVSRITAYEIMSNKYIKDEIIKDSLDYQLFSAFTKYILVDEVPEDEKIFQTPEVYKVKSMVTLGTAMPRAKLVTSSHGCYFNIPAYMRAQDEDITINIFDVVEKIIDKLPSYYIQNSILMLSSWFINNGQKRLPGTLDELKEAGINKKEIISSIDESNIQVFMQKLYERYSQEFDRDVLNTKFIKMLQKKI